MDERLAWDAPFYRMVVFWKVLQLGCDPDSARRVNLTSPSTISFARSVTTALIAVLAMVKRSIHTCIGCQKDWYLGCCFNWYRRGAEWFHAGIILLGCSSRQISRRGWNQAFLDTAFF